MTLVCEALYFEEVAAKLGAEHEMIRKWFEEKNMQKKVLTIQNASWQPVSRAICATWH